MKIPGKSFLVGIAIAAAIALGYYFGFFIPQKNADIAKQQNQDQIAKNQAPKEERVGEGEQKPMISEEEQSMLNNFPSSDEEYIGEPAQINFSHNSGKISAYTYRTALGDSIARGPNFAGHYRIETIGCGANCRILPIIDVRSGNVRFFPDNLPWTTYPGIINMDHNRGMDGVIHSIESNLLILTSYDNRENDEETQRCWKNKGKEEVCELDKTRYFVWKNDKLSEISMDEAANGDGKLGTEIVTLYGDLRQFSSSGCMKFYFDKKMGRGKFPNGDQQWFWGCVTDSNLKYIGEHGDETFVMTGRRNDDDCGYIGDGTCIEDYDIYTVKVAE